MKGLPDDSKTFPPMLSLRCVSADAPKERITMHTETKDTLGEYNNATGIFTAIYDGYYHVDVGVTLQSTGLTEGHFLICKIIKDSSTVRESYIEAQNTGTYILHLTPSTGIYLSASQTIKIDAHQTSGSTKTIDASNRTWLSINRLM